MFFLHFRLWLRAPAVSFVVIPADWRSVMEGAYDVPVYALRDIDVRKFVLVDLISKGRGLYQEDS